MARLEIYLKGSDQRILLDGVPLTCVTELEVWVLAGEAPEVILTLVPEELIVDGEMDVLKDVLDLSTIGDDGLGQ
jgi:hypothetical protein